MGVMAPKSQSTPVAVKRRSGQLDFSKLGPLKTSGTVGFTAFRDSENQSAKKKKPHKRNGSLGGAMDEDSDDDDDEDGAEILGKMEELDTKYDKSKLGPEDARFSGELADGVNRIRVRNLHCSYLKSQKLTFLFPHIAQESPLSRAGECKQLEEITRRYIVSRRGSNAPRGRKTCRPYWYVGRYYLREESTGGQHYRQPVEESSA